MGPQTTNQIVHFSIAVFQTYMFTWIWDLIRVRVHLVDEFEIEFGAFTRKSGGVVELNPGCNCPAD